MDYSPLSHKQLEEVHRFIDLPLEEQLARAHAIILCNHESHNDDTHCTVTRYLKYPREGFIPYAPGEAIIAHERWQYNNAARQEEGMISFFVDGSRMPISNMYIYRGHVAYETASRSSVSVEYLESLIIAANQRMEATRDARASDVEQD